MKKLLAAILCIAMLISMVACKKDPAPIESSKVESSKVESSKVEESSDVIDESTMGGKIIAYFKKNSDSYTDSATAIESLSNCEAIDYATIITEINPGDYMPGFSDEVKGFTKGQLLAPMIGSVPLVVYVFETDDISGLEDELTDKADTRWNICTEAKETILTNNDNVVLFAMLPGDDL